MSSIMKGLLNEVDPRNFDSDIDYYNALNKPRRGRSEDDYVEPQDDEPIRFQQKPDARPQYDISKDEDRQAGYNMIMTVKAPTTQKAEWAASSYVDSNWGAKKQIGNIEKVADGVVKVHMIDNHKYGMWKPWKDEPPIAEPISFNEGKSTHISALTEAKIYKLWETAGQKIVEAQLTQDQINQIFQYVEKIQTASGDNRTLIGKGKDAASAINTAWEDLKTKVQNSGPIQNVDAMYDKAADKLKQATGGDQGVMQYVQKYRDFAKKHPVAQSLIYSALIAAAGISGVGAGGAAALGLFKLVDKLLQGEKFSSAAYSGAKTGAMAYGASKLADYIKGNPDASAGSAPQGPNVDDKIAAARARVDAANAKLGIDGSSPNFDVTGNVAQGGLAAVRQQAGNEAMKAVQQAISNGTTSQGDLSDIAQSVLEKYSTLQGGPLSVQTAETLGQKIAMQAANAAGVMRESKELTESQINFIISKVVARQHKLDEGIMDTVKSAAGKAVDWAKTKGTNLTTKVTADKLLQAWKKAGSPTDSLDVAKIVQNAGIASDTIKQVYGNMKIPFAGEPGANSATRKIDVDPSSVAPPNAPQSSTVQKSEPVTVAPDDTQASSKMTYTTSATVTDKQVQTTYSQVRALIDKLDKRSKQNVVKALKKNLGIALSEAQINELSTDLLANYKKKAGADAAAADKRGDYARGNKRFKGIVRATKKEFDNDAKGVAEGWKEEAEDMGDWAEYVRTKLLKTPQQQRWSVAKQLSQIEVKNFGSELVQRQNYDPKTGKPVASEQLFTQIVQDTLKALNVKPVTGGVALDAEPSEMHKPDDRDGKDWVVSTRMGWLVVPNAGKAPSRIKRMLWKAFLAGPEIYPMALEIFEETGDFTEQDYKNCIVRAAEIRNGDSLEMQAYGDYNQKHPKVAEAKKANTKTARKEFSKRDKKPTLSDKEKDAKQSESDRLWAMLQQHIADAEKNKEVKEANSFFKPGPATTGKFPEPRKPSFPGDQGSKSETLGKDGLIYHWQDPRAKQGVAEDQLDEKWSKKYKDSINCSNPKGFSQKAHCAGKQKNESAIMKGLK